jgi:hypothetical protein
LSELKSINYDNVLSFESKSIRDAVNSRETINKYLSMLEK